MNRMLYDEAAADLCEYHATSGERDSNEAEHRLKHLDAFFRPVRLFAITRAMPTRYAKTRQTEGAANGTINRELGVLRRMSSLAVEDEKFTRALRKIQKEAAPRSHLFERAQILVLCLGRAMPHLFPPLSGRHRGKPITDFRRAWTPACIEATWTLRNTTEPHVWSAWLSWQRRSQTERSRTCSR